MGLFRTRYLGVLLGLLLVVLSGFARADHPGAVAALALSQAESEWLKAHPVIRLGLDPSYGPYSYVDGQGHVQGVVPEFLTHIERGLGVRFEIVSNLEWPALMAAIRERRIDAVATVVKLPELEAFMAFSEIYLPTPLVIMSRDDAPQIRSLDDLQRLRFAMVKGYSSSIQLIERYPQLRPHYVESALDALRAVSAGNADAYVGALGVNTFIAAQHGISNIKVNAGFEMHYNGQRFGVRKDWPELAIILDKALAGIPASAQSEIFARWLPIQSQDLLRLSEPSFVSQAFPWLVGLSALLGLAYLAVWMWNRQLQRELVRRQVQLDRAQRVGRMGDWSMDASTGQVHWSDAMFVIVGRPPQPMNWATVMEWVHPDSRGEHEAYLSRLSGLRSGEQLAPLNSHMLKPDGASRWLEVSCAIDFDKQGRPCRYYGTALDITARRQAEDRIRHLAYFDALTDLPNRRLLNDQLIDAMNLSGETRLYGALLLLDLDQFKDLNESLGHEMGDQLLIEVGRRLRVCAGATAKLGRYGGDEYVLIAENLSGQRPAAMVAAESLAEICRQALSQAYVLAGGDQPCDCSTSIGLVLFRGHEQAQDLLLKQAELALYQAKQAGRNTVCFFQPDMQLAVDERIKMEGALRRSLSRNELHLYYQPQVDATGRCIGAEALLRWFPTWGASIGPAQFVPLAEQSGLILPIGDWVLEEACAQLRRWQANAATAALVLAVNVSARQFHQADFVERITSKIARYGINPTRLKLELTESAVLERGDEVIANMLQLKEIGLSFALDDFGTGYSSLSYLKRLPLDQIKIDQSFVQDICSDPNDAAIVRAILAMSASLGINVIAEGVETEAQRAALYDYGCRQFQGYLYGRPVPIEEWGRG